MNTITNFSIVLTLYLMAIFNACYASGDNHMPEDVVKINRSFHQKMSFRL